MFEKAVERSDNREEAGRLSEYSVDEIRAFLGVSTTTVYGLLRANLFPYGFADGRCEIQKLSFHKWFEALQRDMDECCGR